MKTFAVFAILPLAAFGQFADSYRTSAQAYRNAASIACTASAKQCYLAQAAYHDCLAGQLTGSRTSCTRPPDCTGSGCTGGQTGGSRPAYDKENKAIDASISRQEQAQRDRERALQQMESSIEGLGGAIAARNAARFGKGSRNAAGDRSKADADLAAAIERDISGKARLTAAEIGPSLQGLLAETREECKPGWVDKTYRIGSNGLNQLWLDSSGFFFIGDSEGNAKSTGGYLIAENRRGRGAIYYGLSGVLNNYLGPGAHAEAMPLSIYRSANDYRPTVIEVRAAFCAE